MPDHKFHSRSAALTLKQIAEITGATIAQGADPSFVLEDVSALDTAGKKDLSFLDNVKYKPQFQKTRAGACIVRAELAGLAPKGLHLLVSSTPHKAYALVSQRFYPAARPAARVAASASIDPSVKLGEGCVIEENVVIRAGARLGAGCWIEANTVIGANVIMGDDCRVELNATITHAVIGNNVRIYPGVRIGQDGFGFAPDAAGFVKVPQLGRALIEDDVEIGANCAIDRGSGPDTVIGQGTWLDNLVHVAHNVKIGKYCIIAGQVGFAGSAVIEDFVAMGGQVGISGHLHIGKGAKIAAQSGVTRSVPAGKEYMGYPALPMRQYLRGVALLNRLIKKEKSS